MSVSMKHTQFSKEWYPVSSPMDWMPAQVNSGLFNATTNATLEDDYTGEDWFKLTENTNSLNWKDCAHAPSTAGMNAESLGPYSSDYYMESFWNTSRIANKSPDLNLLKSSEYPGYPHSIARNIDIEAELSRQNLYKTELCRSWVESASCKYGTKCQFAHGQHELRPVIRHPKYKTEICKTFHTNGTCPYGRRCRFVHNTAELRNSPSDSPTDSPIEQLPLVTETEDEELRQLQEQFKLANLAPDPVFYPTQPFTPLMTTDVPAHSPVVSKKGSSLPFFQKLRKEK